MATSPSAAVSTNRVEPQMKTRGSSAAGHATSPSISASMRRAYPVQPGGCERVSVWKTSSPSAGSSSSAR